MLRFLYNLLRILVIVVLVRTVIELVSRIQASAAKLTVWPLTKADSRSPWLAALTIATLFKSWTCDVC